MRFTSLLFIGLLCATMTHVSAQDTAQIIIKGRVNSATQMSRHYVILISADGFRWDLATKYKAQTLLNLSNSGVTAAYMQSSFPSLTFPNHYSIITGLYPGHHGLVDNTFYDKAKNNTYSMGKTKLVRDSSWYGGKPLWVLAEQAHMLTASFFWVGSEAAMEGVRPTYYYNFNDKIDIDTRLHALKKWLMLPDSVRPHFITFYMSNVDHAEHRYGPDSKETEEAVQFVDAAIKKMTDSLATLHLPIDYIFVSDHGMTAVDTKNTLSLPKAVDTAKFKCLGGGSLVHLYAKKSADILPTYKAIKSEAKDYDVYLVNVTYMGRDGITVSDLVPMAYNYNSRSDGESRIGDIVLMPHLPKVFNLGGWGVPMGQHGFDPAITDMHATFYAWGPDFKEHVNIPGFENVNIYPLVAKLLNLKFTQPIDGKLSVLSGILK